jgi:hypothetical protein
MLTVIERITTHAKLIADGEHDRIRPGLPFKFSAATQPGDGCWQGDLGIEIVDRVPGGYCEVDPLKEEDKQLVPGSTSGAKHCLKSLKGVRLYRPIKWDEESLQGPCLATTRPATILHPIHGPVTIPADVTVLCRYQREWDKEQQRERRTLD